MASDKKSRLCAFPMASSATFFLRLVALLAALTLTIAALVVSAQIAQQSMSGGPGELPLYVILGLAVSSTSVVILLPLIVLQVIRPCWAPLWLEITWTLLLGGCWSALAIKQSMMQDKDHSLTSYEDRPKIAARFTALQDASFLAWAMLWSWSLWVTVLALRAWRSGHSRVLQCPTRQVKFLEIKPVLVVEHQPPRFSMESHKTTASNPPR
ncbi:hypothetical protein BKA62DRAFT_691491 [Auriculariales sp. MPI-PUGE-AT-0066]|nr:hypothetical protein BKA62DRAFT_691491 [Auriculariales sp. MPI-PUGE-AT-0066]